MSRDIDLLALAALATIVPARRGSFYRPDGRPAVLGAAWPGKRAERKRERQNRKRNRR